MSRRPSEGPGPHRGAPPAPSPSRRRPDLDPVARAWETWPAEAGEWRGPPPSISKRDDPWRGERFFRALIAMQEERRAAREALIAAVALRQAQDEG